MYNTTISNSYKDEKSGEWKPTSSYSPTDLLVLADRPRGLCRHYQAQAAGPRPLNEYHKTQRGCPVQLFFYPLGHNGQSSLFSFVSAARRGGRH